jgi:hypothetical protein
MPIVGRFDKALYLVQHPSVAKFVGDIRQDLTQNFAVAPRLKSTMDRFVVRIALRQHVQWFRMRLHCSSLGRIIQHL